MMNERSNSERTGTAAGGIARWVGLPNDHECPVHGIKARPEQSGSLADAVVEAIQRAKSSVNTGEKWMVTLPFDDWSKIVRLAEGIRIKSSPAPHYGSPVPMATLLEDRNLDAMLSVMAARSGGDMRNVERCDLRAAIVEVLGWEGIHA